MIDAEDFKALHRKHINRAGAEALLEWMEKETDFFVAPASAGHHLNWPGGLVAHSGNVFQELCRVMADDEESMETAAICGLLHDLCKANYYSFEYDPKARVSRYTVRNSFPFGHGEKSVLLISRFMVLTDEEALAIRWHMGAYDEAVKGGSRDLNEAMDRYRLVYELHAADMRASHILEAAKKETK